MICTKVLNSIDALTVWLIWLSKPVGFITMIFKGGALLLLISVIQLVSSNQVTLSSSSSSSLPSSVFQYNAEEFRKYVPKRDHYVLFYIPWSGECQNVARLWQELAYYFHPSPDWNVVLAKVDCTTETELCTTHNIPNFPAAIYFKTGGDPFGRRYNGKINLAPMENFMFENLDELPKSNIIVARIPKPEGGLYFLYDEVFNGTINNVNVTQSFVCFCTTWSTKCLDLLPIWVELAKEFRYEIGLIVGFVDCTRSKRTCKNNDVVGYPSLLWIQNGTVIDKYLSPVRSFKNLKQWVLKKLGKNVVATAPSSKKTNSIDISAENLLQAIDEEQLLFIQFRTPWCSQDLYDTWQNLQFHFNDKSYGKESKILINIFDCATNWKACYELKVRFYPTLIVYKYGRQYKKYSGDLEIDSLIRFVKTIIIDPKEEL